MEYLKEKDIHRVSDRWGIAPPDLNMTFFGFPPIRDYIFTCISNQIGKAARDFAERWTVETFLKEKIPVEECLSLCCGFGEIERILADLGVFRHCIGIDITERAVKNARRKAKEGDYNIDYKVCDLNVIQLEPEKYDLIWANGALHHITNLEYLVAEIYKALKPGAFFVCNEYIGPKYQKLPFRQQEIINSVIHLIPHRYRFASEETYVPAFYRNKKWRWILWELYRMITFQTGGIDVDMEPRPDWAKFKIKLFNTYKKIRNSVFTINKRRKISFHYGKVWQERSEEIKLNDPSEGIRSDEIIPILKRTFDHLDIRFYNGSILFYALDHKFYKEFNPDREEDRSLLELLITIEKTMINIGELKSDFAHIIAKKSQ